jgi:hypothetical protein
MRTVQRAAFWFGIINLVTGFAGFMAPLVKGSRQRWINTGPGLLFGLFATN